ncbi:SPOR domain-containing protein [Rheinheimera oceanensis]|uniref:SPOR domain-containing protein n=1 Tax=Rheinheimera oceanensis TaxID=2817449 RepID=UPI001BFED51F|nr:SPOR domain-containing protein [Rheinheimera oceanensis]
METTELQARLALFDHLLPSQREWTERLLFQLAFNNIDHIEAVGAVGSGKSTLALTLAELFSEQYNVALLNTPADEAQVASQLMQQWFGLPAQAGVALSEQVAAQDGVTPLLLIVDNTEQFSSVLPQLQNLPCLLFSFSTKPLLDNSLTLTISPPTSADAEYLLQAEQLNPLEMSNRLTEANGNLHLLLRPAAVKPVAEPEYTKPAMPPFKAVYMVIAAVMVAMLLYFFWPESKTADTPVRIPVQVPAVTIEPEVNAEPEISAENDPVIDVTPEPELIPVIPPPVESSAVEDITTEVVTEPVEPEPVVKDSAIAAGAFKYDEAQLLEMDRQQVALQLAVLSSNASLQRFNKTYPQLDSLVYQRNWQGKTQWVILLAPFSNAAAANQQLAQLPEALRAGGPFVKRLQAIQTEINALQRNQQSVPE